MDGVEGGDRARVACPGAAAGFLSLLRGAAAAACSSPESRGRFFFGTRPLRVHFSSRTCAAPALAISALPPPRAMAMAAAASCSAAMAAGELYPDPKLLRADEATDGYSCTSSTGEKSFVRDPGEVAVGIAAKELEAGGEASRIRGHDL